RPRRVFRHPQKEFRRLVVEALISPPETSDGRPPHEGRRGPVCGDRIRSARVAGRPSPLRTQASILAVIENMKIASPPVGGELVNRAQLGAIYQPASIVSLRKDDDDPGAGKDDDRSEERRVGKERGEQGAEE